MKRSVSSFMVRNGMDIETAMIARPHSMRGEAIAKERVNK